MPTQPPPGMPPLELRKELCTGHLFYRLYFQIVMV